MNSIFLWAATGCGVIALPVMIGAMIAVPREEGRLWLYCMIVGVIAVLVMIGAMIAVSREDVRVWLYCMIVGVLMTLIGLVTIGLFGALAPC